MDLKERARTALHTSYWKYVLVGFFFVNPCENLTNAALYKKLKDQHHGRGITIINKPFLATMRR